MRASILLLALVFGPGAAPAPFNVPLRPAGLKYPWLRQPPSAAATVAARFPTPGGSRRVVAVQPGDLLIHGGRPGHAVLVVDVAENSVTHQKFMLLAQSYMPAQSIHLLRNIDDSRLGAWFAVPGPAQAEIDTPEWTFRHEELGRFEWLGQHHQAIARVF